MQSPVEVRRAVAFAAQTTKKQDGGTPSPKQKYPN